MPSSTGIAGGNVVREVDAGALETRLFSGNRGPSLIHVLPQAHSLPLRARITLPWREQIMQQMHPAEVPAHPPRGPEPERRRENIGRSVTLTACAWVAVAAGATLIGWWLGDERWIRFPAPLRYGTMMPLTAVNLLLCAGALWLLRTEPVPDTHRRVAYGLVVLPTVISLLVLIQVVTGTDFGIDLILFPETVRALAPRQPGLPSLAASVCLLAISLVVVTLDARSTRVRRLAEFLMLFVLFIALERLISYFFREISPAWRLFREPLFIPMSPRTASCFVALALGFLYARPHRGLIGLYLAEGPGGLMARRVLPAATILAVVFGWLSLEAMRAGLRGTFYPLSLVVSFQIVLLFLIIVLSAREIERLELERLQAEAAVIERERVLGAVFDNAGAGIAVSDHEGRLIKANPTFQNMVGYTGEELSRMRFTDLTHPDDIEVSWRLFQEVLAGTRDSYRIEKRYIRKDGSQFWIQLTTSVARVDRKRAEFVIGLVEDITERKKTEAAKARLTAILEATPDFVGMSDASGRAEYVNQAGRRLTGTEDRDLTEMRVADFHPPDAARLVMGEGVPTAMREGVWVGESELLGADGRHIPVSQVILAHRDPIGKVVYFSTIIRDISDRKRMEEGQRFLLEAGHAFSGSLDIVAILRSIAELSVPDLADRCTVDLVTRDGRIDRAVTARAYPDRTFVMRQRRHPAGKEPNPVAAEVIRSREPKIIATVTDEWLKNLTREGHHQVTLSRPRPQSIMMVPLPGRDQVQGLICLVISRPGRRYDEHDLRLASELAVRAGLALDNARLFEESRQATRVRDEVLRIVAHDLRNPLNTISLSTDMLGEQLPRAAEAPWAGTLDIIERSVAQADDLIQDLLDVARMQAGKLSVESQPCDARELATDAVEMHESIAAQRGIQLRSDVPEIPSLILADRHRVLQVFSNLIGNALKFSPEGSTVIVAARAHDHAVRFSVSDNGPGIAESDMQHLFDPFWQARTSTGGAGLGLPIAQGIVQAHGGRIWARSRLGEGTTFFFTLPVASSAGAKAAD